MFIQPCFIRKNTPELRKKLEKLGYNRYPLWMADWSDDDSRYVYLVTDILYYTYPQKPTNPKNGKYIDCGTNEELFIAIASMTDNEHGLCDYYIVTTDCNLQYAKGSIHRALPISSVIHPSCYRKATVEELIEYFKK